MTMARSEQVSVDSTPFYHCIARCVRRAFLCGEDRFSGQSFEHRKGWLLERMKELGSVFAIDICAYAVMSNHFHLVVRLVPERAAAWDSDELLRRVRLLFGPTAAAIEQLRPKARQKELEKWRDRLSDLSWFMRCLNESIARRANREDACTGRFWEGRFKSQALLDEGALLTCMSYVDLNPVRAGLADRLEDSDFTSIQERLAQAAITRTAITQTERSDDGEQSEEREAPEGDSDRTEARASSATPRPTRDLAALAPLEGEGPPYAIQADHAIPLPIRLEDYAALLEEVGAALRADGKQGVLAPSARSTLSRLGLDPDAFVQEVRGFGMSFYSMVGSCECLHQEKARLGRKQVKGIRAAERLYRAAA